MHASPQLKQQIARAVRTSMRIEGYCTVPPPQAQALAKALMEQHRVKVSIRQSDTCPSP